MNKVEVVGSFKKRKRKKGSQLEKVGPRDPLFLEKRKKKCELLIGGKGENNI